MVKNNKLYSFYELYGVVFILLYNNYSWIVTTRNKPDSVTHTESPRYTCVECQIQSNATITLVWQLTKQYQDVSTGRSILGKWYCSPVPCDRIVTPNGDSFWARTTPPLSSHIGQIAFCCFPSLLILRTDASKARICQNFLQVLYKN